MSGSRSGSSAPPSPARPALDALLAEPAGNPIRRALWLDTLDRRLRPCLPPSLAAHSQLANISGNRLVFVVEGPVWHARLRLAEDRILDAARSIGLDVNAIIVKTITAPLHSSRAPSGPTLASDVSPVAREALQTAHALLNEAVSDDNPAKKPNDLSRNQSKPGISE